MNKDGKQGISFNGKLIKPLRGIPLSTRIVEVDNLLTKLKQVKPDEYQKIYDDIKNAAYAQTRPNLDYIICHLRIAIEKAAEGEKENSIFESLEFLWKNGFILDEVEKFPGHNMENNTLEKIKKGRIIKSSLEVQRNEQKKIL